MGAISRKEKISKKESSSLAGFLSGKLVLIIYIPILLFSFLNIYNNIFDRKIDLGGDNANYYILGQSLANGTGFTNIHSKEMEPHAHFPPGYPAIIAVASKLFSNDIIFIKKVNGFLFAVSLMLLFLIVYEVTGNFHLPFITTLIVMLNFHLLHYSTIMMSEIPFLCFSLLAIWLAMKTNYKMPPHKNWKFILLLLVLSFTYFIRSTGVALVGGLTLFLAYQRHWKYLVSMLAGFVLLALPWYIRVRSLNSNSYLDQLVQKNPYQKELGTMGFTDWFDRIWVNFERYVAREIPSGMFNFVKVGNYQEPIVASEWIVGVITIPILIFGLLRLRKYKVFLASYLLATFGILLIWPDVWFGIRFLLPLIPILIFLLVYAVSEVFMLLDKYLFKKKRPQSVYLLVILLGFVYIQVDAKESVDDLETRAKGYHVKKYRNYFELAQWVGVNAADTSVTVCRKGPLFYLYSQKYVTNYKYTSVPEEQIEFLKSQGADYVVMEQLGYSSTGRYLYPAIEKYPAKFKVIKHLEDPDTYLMRFLPNMGYSGEFEDGKRSGHGTFVWEDGNRFEGQWRDHKRNGPGILYLKDGRRLEGHWENDTLKGEVIMKSKKGEVLKKSLFKNGKEVALKKEDPPSEE